MEQDKKETLACDKNLQCHIPENILGLSCNSNELKWIVDKNKKTMSQPRLRNEFKIEFTRGVDCENPKDILF